MFREKLYLRHALLKFAVGMLQTSLSLEPEDPWAGFYRLQCAEHAARMFEDLLSDYERAKQAPEADERAEQAEADEGARQPAAEADDRWPTSSAHYHYQDY